MENRNDEIEYTEYAWESLYNTVDEEKYNEQEAAMIYKTLDECIKRVSFGDYLKRYIYLKAEMTEAFSEVDLSVYQQIIKDSFAESNTPKAFTESTAKLSALSKNWLTQLSVKRNVIFLLGFGLSMSVDDVNTFLTKAIQEPGINPKNPFEVICWYCYKNHYNYIKYEKLWDMYIKTSEKNLPIDDIYGSCTIGLRSDMQQIKDDTALMIYLTKLKTAENKSKVSVTAKQCFDELYKKGQECIADYYNMDVDNNAEYKPEEIGPADFEMVLYSAVPKDHYGNLTPAKSSRLNGLFLGRRLTRQRIHEILCGEEEINRFDLLTLNFLIYSQNEELYDKPQKRYTEFMNSTNQMLLKCFMGTIYIQNPYECFLLMCLLSDDPLETYSEVWELSY